MWYKLAINTQYPQESLFFQPWHEGDLIRDDQEKPKVLYHGTLSPQIQSFDPSKFENDSSFGPAVYTTEHPQDANDNYANPEGGDWKVKIGNLADQYDDEEKAKEEILGTIFTAN